MGMDDHQDFDTFACSVESTPVQTPRSFFKISGVTPRHENRCQELEESGLDAVTKVRKNQTLHSILFNSNENLLAKGQNLNTLQKNVRAFQHPNSKSNYTKQITKATLQPKTSTTETKSSAVPQKIRPLTIPRGPTFLQRLEVAQHLKNQHKRLPERDAKKSDNHSSDTIKVKGKTIPITSQYKNVPSRYLSSLQNKTKPNNKRTQDEKFESKTSTHITKITTIRQPSKFGESVNSKRKLAQISSENEQGRNKVRKTVHGTSVTSTTISTVALNRSNTNVKSGEISNTSQAQQPSQKRTVTKRRITVPITPMCLRRSLQKPKEKLLTTEERVMLEAKKQREEFLKMQAQKRKVLKLAKTPIISESNCNDISDNVNKENVDRNDKVKDMPNGTELLRLQEEEERKALKARLRYFSRPPLLKAPTPSMKFTIT